MRRLCSLLMMLTLFAASLGCEERSPTPRGKVSGTPSAATGAKPVPIPSSQATGVWSKSQVETYLKDDLKLVDVSISETTSNNYTGTGHTADRKTLQLKVKQVPGGIACRYTDGEGGSGRIAFGNKVSDD